MRQLGPKINSGKDTLGVFLKFIIYFKTSPKKINTFKHKLKIVKFLKKKKIYEFNSRAFQSFLRELFKNLQ